MAQIAYEQLWAPRQTEQVLDNVRHMNGSDNDRGFAVGEGGRSFGAAASAKLAREWNLGRSGEFKAIAACRDQFSPNRFTHLGKRVLNGVER